MAQDYFFFFGFAFFFVFFAMVSLLCWENPNTY